jgi:hypothetical protein
VFKFRRYAAARVERFQQSSADPQLFVSPLALLEAHDVNSDMNHKFANRMLWNMPTDEFCVISYQRELDRLLHLLDGQVYVCGTFNGPSYHIVLDAAVVRDTRREGAAIEYRDLLHAGSSLSIGIPPPSRR